MKMGEGEGRSWHLIHSQQKPLFSWTQSALQWDWGERETGARPRRSGEGGWGEEKTEPEKGLERELETDLESPKERGGRKKVKAGAVVVNMAARI